MARKKKENIETYNIQDAREALDRLESKLDTLTKAVEQKNNASKLSKVNSSNLKVKSIPLPTDIEIDTKDKYNTQPKNSATHNFFKNYRMFRKDITRNTLKSKLFWGLLIALPMIMTLIIYLVFSWAYTSELILSSSFPLMIMNDLINYFILMPLLLMSLIIFPSFIAMTRETNQLKRYSMNGMSRKQIYWNYTIYSIAFLVILFLFWVGPWLMIINKITDTIYLTPEQVAAGEHVWNNPWSIFLGFNFSLNKTITTINVYDLNEFLTNLGLGPFDIDTLGSVLLNYLHSIDNLDLISDLLNIQFKNVDQTLSSLHAAEYSNGIIKFDRIFYLVERNHLGIKKMEFLTLLILLLMGINSVGFNKAMKIKSSSGLMGWGIGLWIFSTIIIGSSSLLYNDVYKFDEIDNKLWNTIVMILLLIVKWMFLLSPVTIMYIGIILASQVIVEPAVSDTLLKPHTITIIFESLSAFWAIMWTLKVWIRKSKIVSYESAR